MENLISILQKRDGVTRQEAIATLNEAWEAILHAIDTGEDDPEEVFMDYVGLEADYLHEFLSI